MNHHNKSYPQFVEEKHRINMGHYDIEFRSTIKGHIYEVRTWDGGQRSHEYMFASPEYWEAVILFHEVVDNAINYEPLTLDALRAATIAITRLGKMVDRAVLRQLIGWDPCTQTQSSYNTYAARVDLYFESGQIK
tara:strand:+ start:2026 stop:2430 length:405 start_codon:yes stop_codon:yes gene_type:complete